MKKYLEKHELHLVRPKFHSIVTEAWDRGEDVPYAVTALSDRPPTDAQIKRGIELMEKYNWNRIE